MGLSVKLKIQDTSAKWLKQEEIRVERGLRLMAQDGVNLARMAVPKRTGALSETGHIEGMGLVIRAIYGDHSAPYGGIQERKQFQHYTTPGTGPHYLKKGCTDAVEKGIRAFL